MLRHCLIELNVGGFYLSFCINRLVFVKNYRKYISMVQICKIHGGKYKLKFKRTLAIEGPVSSFGVFITLHIYIYLYFNMH